MKQPTYPQKAFWQKFFPFSFFQRFVTLIFLPHCAGCKRAETFLCENCLARLPISTEKISDEIFSVFDYQNPVVKQVIWLLKYRGIRDLARTMARPMYELALSELFDQLLYAQNKGKILVIPAPLSKKRLRERGFNQAEEIARHFVSFDPKSFSLESNLVAKIKDTKPQVSMKNRRERLKNLQGAFRIQHSSASDPHGSAKLKKRLKGKIVILIDDVCTTGATIEELRKTLKKAGVRQVFGLTSAHG